MKLNKIISFLLVGILLLADLIPALAITDNAKEKNKKEKEQSVIEYVNLPWWQDFQDEYLENYIKRAIENNPDLKIATLKVEEARQNVKMQMSQELPQLIAGASPAIAKMSGTTNTSGTFAIPVIASYELDIFLKNHDKTKSIKKLYEASKLSEKASYIAISSAVGATYYNIVRADKMIDLQEKIVADRKQIFDLMKLRNDEGITSTADLVKAEKGYIIAETSLTDLKKLRTNLLTSLAVLIGDSPQNIDEYKRISYDKLELKKQIPTSIPSDVITNRPDYLVAQKMIEKAGIDVRVAKKEFLPSFNLGGLLGIMALNNGMSWKNSIAGAGALALIPAFTGGRRIASLKIHKNKYEQSIQEYQKTNITAIKEVNDALSDLQYDNDKYLKNVKALRMEEKDFAFTKSKYKQGVISYLDLIQKREALLSTQKLTASNYIDVYMDQISLYKTTAAANL